jgi:peptidoglycan/LPS O-acetylase OafA/YrhL
MIWFALIAPYAKSAIVAAGTADLRFVAAAIGPPAAFVLILRSALRVRSVPSLVQRVSAASYTIYVLHLPLVVVINLALRGSMVNVYCIYVISVIISASIAFAFHEAIVSRSSILLLVLNGDVKRHMAKNARLGARISHQNEDAEIRFIPGVTAAPALQTSEHDLDLARRL